MKVNCDVVHIHGMQTAVRMLMPRSRKFRVRVKVVDEVKGDCVGDRLQVSEWQTKAGEDFIQIFMAAMAAWLLCLFSLVTKVGSMQSSWRRSLSRSQVYLAIQRNIIHISNFPSRNRFRKTKICV